VLRVNSLEVAGRVKGASIQVGYGEIVGIAGLEGQGQAEFLRALYGMFPFTGGVEFEGKSVKIKSPGEAVKKGIGFISGDRDREGIFPVRSVTENILIAHNAASPVFSFLGETKQKEQSKTIIEQLRILSAGTGTQANSLSGGNQQKLLVGRWLFMKPKLLLLDDPTKGVDINAREEINSLLKDMTKTGMAVIFSSSDNEELLRMAARIYVFYEHKIVSELSDKSLDGKILAETMLGART
jgi:ABC-type sugar transport system ATPase subunit